MKRILGIILLAFTLLPLQAQEGRPRVAVVLSGGGAKGVAHISVLRAIEEAGIPVDIVCGTSMGSLVGGLYAVGWTPDEIDSLVRAQNWLQLLSDRIPPSQLTLDQRQRNNTYTMLRTVEPGSLRIAEGGAIRGYNLDRLFSRVYAGFGGNISFDSLPIPFACVATDMVEGTEVDLRHGELKQALRASMAIPGAFTPVKLGDKLLVDGGLMNNFPVDLARRMGADIVIGVSVQSQYPTIDEMGDALSILLRITDLAAQERYAANVADADLFIQVNVDGYSPASFTTEAIDSLLARGRQAADANRDALLALRRTHGIDSTARPAWLQRHPASYLLPEAAPVKTEGLTMGLGLRFDTEEMGAILIGLHAPLGKGFPAALDFSLRLGQLLRAGVALSATRLPYPSLEYNFFRNDFDLYLEGDRVLNTRYVQHQASVYPLRAKLRMFDMMAGLRWDYYNYYSGILTAFSNAAPLPAHEHFLSWRVGLSQNSEDHWYFPTRGMRVGLGAAYVTDNLVGFGSDPGMVVLSGHWRLNIPLAERLTLQPTAYGRLLFGDRTPLVLSNLVRGNWFGHTFEQLMPFPGVHNIELVQPRFLAGQLQLQYRLWRGHYALARAALAASVPELEEIFDHPLLAGAELGYSFNSFFGPLELKVGYSNITDALGLFVSLGHVF